MGRGHGLDGQIYRYLVRRHWRSVGAIIFKVRSPCLSTLAPARRATAALLDGMDIGVLTVLCSPWTERVDDVDQWP